MSFQHPVFALVAFALALALGAIGARIDPPPMATNRALPVDGLRGLLAFAVFLHHCVIWHAFAAGEGWHTPASALYAHLGDSAVMLFFMITAFLFTSKILASSDARPVDWRGLYIGRFFRIMPLYAVVVACIVLVVFACTGFTLDVSVLVLVKSIARWLAVTLFGSPPINGLAMTPLVVAGVTWSLRYEVLYYSALGFIALAMRRPVSLRVLFPTGIALAISLHAIGRPGLPMMMAFGIGTAAAFASRIGSWQAFARRRAADLIVVLSACLAVVVYPDGRQPGAVLLFGAAFCLIASGADLFGLLGHRATRYLGEISFSIYLVHGLVLFVCFEFVVGVQRAARLDALQHWGIALACVPIVIALAGLCFHAVERPGIEAGRRIARKTGKVARDAPIADVAGGSGDRR